VALAAIGDLHQEPRLVRELSQRVMVEVIGSGFGALCILRHGGVLSRGELEVYRSRIPDVDGLLRA